MIPSFHTQSYFPVALCELFDKADTGGDGTISLEEYMVMCDEYGIELTEEHLKEVRGISNENGEVKRRIWCGQVLNLFSGP